MIVMAEQKYKTIRVTSEVHDYLYNQSIQKGETFNEIIVRLLNKIGAGLKNS